jgi:hypothetical protein
MVTLPAARTPDEANLYLDLHPCERCGAADVAWESAMIDDGRAQAYRYHGTCATCGALREFFFAVPSQPTPRRAATGPDGGVSFGGPEPSQLLDPGEWLLVAEMCARVATVPDGSAADSPAQREARESLTVAAAAVDEVLKFVPAGTNTVPESAFWSARGRAVLHQEPGRFHRRRLLIIRDSYEESLARMSASW